MQKVIDTTAASLPDAATPVRDDTNIPVRARPSDEGIDRQSSARRGGALPTDLKDVIKFLDEVAKKFAFEKDMANQADKAKAKINEAWRSINTQNRSRLSQYRAKLMVLTNGRIEKWISDSSDEGIIAFFREVWRD